MEPARHIAWTLADMSKTGGHRLGVIKARIWLKALGYELADFVPEVDSSAHPAA